MTVSQINWISEPHSDKRTRPWTTGNGEDTTEKEKPMASESKETRLRQRTEWEVKLNKRLALLAGKGLDEKKISQDVQIKGLKAKIKESQARLRAIDATEKRTAELAAIKAERLAKPKEEAPKAKKAEEQSPETKAKKKKKVEEQPSEDKPKKKKKKEEAAQSQES
jgi:hypothetical protein